MIQAHGIFLSDGRVELNEATKVITERLGLPPVPNVFNLAGYLAEAWQMPYPVSVEEAEQMIIAAVDGEIYQRKPSVLTKSRSRPVKKASLQKRLKNKKIGEIVSRDRRKGYRGKVTSYVVKSDSVLEYGDIVINPGRNGATVWMEVIDKNGSCYNCKPI